MRVPEARRFTDRFQAIRKAQRVPDNHPMEVRELAHARAARGPALPVGSPADYTDRRDLELVTIDPPGSMDLDQAFGASRRGEGYRVHYAIADVASFVECGDVLDREGLARGLTLYSPDRRTSLYPEVLSEGAASLLPDQDRPAVLWTLDLDATGELTDIEIDRAMVRSRAQLTYAQVQTGFERRDGDDPLRLLAEIGPLRQRLARQRGAVELNLPSQEVVAGEHGYVIAYDVSLPVEEWNAQISLLTGIAAARLMRKAKTGLLRNLPPPNKSVVRELRKTATALGVAWPRDTTYAERVRTLDRSSPAEVALLTQSAKLLRGAGYLAFGGRTPRRSQHSAIAAHYAHVTAPLRRVCDRYANEILISLAAENPPPQWAVTGIHELPKIMQQAGQRSSQLERAIVDTVEALVLEPHIGETFDGVITRIHRDHRATVQLREPAIVSHTQKGDWRLGDEVSLRLDEVDADRPELVFSRPGTSRRGR